MAFGDPAPVSLATSSLVPQASSPLVAPLNVAQPKPGINWLGVLADALAGAAGRQGPYAAMLMQQRQLEQQQASEQSQSDRELQRQKDFYQFQLDHPQKKDPVGYAAELASMGINPGTPEFNSRMDAHLKAVDDPLVTMTLPGDRVYSGPRSGLASALGGTGGGIPHVSDKAGYDAIPPGGQYIDPQGNVRTKGGQSGASSTGDFH